MKQVVLEVEEKKYRLKNFDFVNVVKENVAKKNAIKMIAQGMQDAVLASEEKIKTRSAKDFLNEL